MVIVFHQKPTILATAAIGGPLEAKSVFKSYFDYLSDDEYFNEKTHEQAQAKQIDVAITELVRKAKIDKTEIKYFFSGDLINQMTPTSFAVREIATAFIGLFSACATSVSAAIIASLLVELNVNGYMVAGASSHHSATERQFRYPLLYGAQKPATAQWTVTAGGYVLLGPYVQGKPYISSATFGHVIDFNVTDPFHMGGAMAPAAFDTISRHLKAMNTKLDDYDVIMTGDLGKIGLQLLKGCFTRSEHTGNLNVLRDAGAEFYGEDSFFQAGASGAGCSAAIFYGYALEQFSSGRFKRVLLVATGALLSPLSYQQGASIPSIAHAIEIRMDEGE